MFCNQCGQSNSNDSKFCSSCGTRLETPNNQNTILEQPSIYNQTKQIELWNPNAAANWSLLFTPIFGSYLQFRNWQTLGNKDEADNARNWFIFSILFILFITLGTPFIWDDPVKLNTYPKSLGVLYLIIWYFSFARIQPKYVQEKLRDKYQKKSWGIPLISGLAVYIASTFIFLIIGDVIASKVQSQQTPSDSTQTTSSKEQPENGENGIIPPISSSLTCKEDSGSSAKGLEFYGPISYKLSDNNPVKTEITWGVKYTDLNMQNDSHTGSLRIRLYALSEPYSGSDLNGYVIGEYYPHFNSDGSASENQLIVNHYVESIISKDEKHLKIPSGKYCTVITLEEFDQQNCSSADNFCIQSWMQFKNPSTFF